MLAKLKVGDFGILECGKDCVQTIRGSNGFQVERRNILSLRPHRFEHRKAGRIEDEVQLAILELEDFEAGPENFLPGFSNELLEMNDLLLLFENFWHSRDLYKVFVWQATDLETDAPANGTLGS